MMNGKPLMIDGFCGLGGASEGFIAEGWECVGFDNERHVYGEQRYPVQLVIQDIMTVHGKQFADADFLWFSPPCQTYSWMAMPWSLGKQRAAEYRSGVRSVDDLNALFNACFRIQREACEAAGRHIPMIVENVRGAIPWVGQSAWHYGSFHLWGDVPALMPISRAFKMGRAPVIDGVTRRLTNAAEWDGVKAPGMNWSDQAKRGQDFTRCAVAGGYDGLKLPGNNGPRRWEDREVQRLCDAGTKGSEDQLGGDRRTRFDGGLTKFGSKSNSRKAASAQIAKIPLPLSRHIARCYYPQVEASCK